MAELVDAPDLGSDVREDVWVRVPPSPPNKQFEIYIMDLNNFKEIPEYPEYLISEDGRVYSTKSNRLLKLTKQTRGYLIFRVTYNKISKTILLHRALARVYLGLDSLDSDFEVDHIDNDKYNNRLDNLQILSPKNHTTKTLQDKGLPEYEKKYCKVCNKRLDGRSKTGFCIKHMEAKSLKINIPKTEIESNVKTLGWVGAAQKFNCSDSGLRKAYKRLGGNPKTLKKVY